MAEVMKYPVFVVHLTLVGYNVVVGHEISTYFLAISVDWLTKLLFRLVLEKMA